MASKGPRPATQKRAAAKGIQAILLADSFMTPHRFRPMTKSTPKVLLPVVNVPMLEYTLQFLSSSNVDDIIIYAASHADQIQSYINTTRWLHKQPELKVQIIVSAESRSVGDALRDIDQRDIARPDFLLLTGDIISNIDLNPIIVEHRQKSLENPDLSCTMLFTTVEPGHAMRSRTDDLTVATDRTTNRILYYSDNIQQGKVELSFDLLHQHGKNGINIQANAFDTGILICNRRLLNVFSENFDYQDVRQDYITQQLDLDPDSAIPPDHIYSHIITKGAYATRIVDMRTYHTCSHDIIRKWVSPLVVSNNVLGKTSYKSYPNNVYREDNVSLSHTSLLKADCVVGRKTKIGHSTLLHKSIIGRNVVIGNLSSLTTCYVLDSTTIGDGCVLNGAWVGKNVKIGNNVTIHKGAVIDDNVIISDNVIVPPYVSITTNPLDDEESNALTAENRRITALLRKSRFIDITQHQPTTLHHQSTLSTTPTPSNATTNQTLTSSAPSTSAAIASTPLANTPTISPSHSQHSQHTQPYIPSEQLALLDHYPIDGRTFFYNNETDLELAARIRDINSFSINTDGYDEEGSAFPHLNSFPRIMLPSLEVLQLDSSPHQVFAKQTMSQIVHFHAQKPNTNNTPFNGLKNNNLLFHDDLDDDLFMPSTQPIRRHNSHHSYHAPMYSQRDTDLNFSPYTNKGYEALINPKDKKLQGGGQLGNMATLSNNGSINSPSSADQNNGFTMLSPSTLQQTLTNNNQEVNRALSQNLPYYPLADLRTLHALQTQLIVGSNGRGRIYLHPPHEQYGRAIVLLNSTAPPAYFSLQNYPLLTKSQVIAETIDYYDNDDSDFGYGEEDEEDDDEDDYQDLDPDGTTLFTTPGLAIGASNDDEDDDGDDDMGRATIARTTLLSPQPSLLQQNSLFASNSINIATSTDFSETRTFIHEIITTITNAKDVDNIANALKELPTLRLVYADVGFEAYLCAVFLGLFSLSQLPPPDRGIYKPILNIPAAQLPWEQSTAIEIKKSQALLAKYFRLWKSAFKVTDTLSLLFPALTAACLLNDKYSELYYLLIQWFYNADLITEDQIVTYHQRVKPLTTLHTPAKSLLPSMVDYTADNQIHNLDKLVKIMERIIEELQDEDEDEDDEDDE